MLNKHAPEIVKALRDYVAQLLDVRLTVAPVAAPALPAFLRDRYALHSTTILHQRCLLLTALNPLDETPGTIAKHLDVVRRSYPGDLIIVVADRISTHNRQRLIAQHVPFIIPGNQMFVPDLAVDLREHFRKGRETPADTLSPTAQLLVLAAVRGDLVETTASVLADRFGTSAMSMSRALDELAALNLATTEVRGKYRHLHIRHQGPALWAQARALLRSPVRKRRTVRWCPEATQLPLAGESALAQWTDLSAPVLAVHAIAASDWTRFAAAHGLGEPAGWNEPQIEIETWSYDPLSLGDARIVDPLSLWLSLPESNDDRFGLAKDALLKEAGL